MIVMLVLVGASVMQGGSWDRVGGSHTGSNADPEWGLGIREVPGAAEGRIARQDGTGTERHTWAPAKSALQETLPELTP